MTMNERFLDDLNTFGRVRVLMNARGVGCHTFRFDNNFGASVVPSEHGGCLVEMLVLHFHGDARGENTTVGEHLVGNVASVNRWLESVEAFQTVKAMPGTDDQVNATVDLEQASVDGPFASLALAFSTDLDDGVDRRCLSLAHAQRTAAALTATLQPTPDAEDDDDDGGDLEYGVNDGELDYDIEQFLTWYEMSTDYDLGQAVRPTAEANLKRLIRRHAP